MVGKNIIASAIGGIIGEISFCMASSTLMKYYDNDISRFDNNDILNLIFINNDYKTIEYIDEQNIMILMIPITFLFVGLLLSCEFLSKPKKYYSMIACRTENYKELYQIIYGKPLCKIIFYVLSYSLVIAIQCKQKNNYIDIFTMTVVYIIFIYFLSRIAFLIYKSGNSGFAIMSSLIILMFVYLFDMHIPNLDIVLYNTYNYSTTDIITLIILMLAVTVTDICISRKRGLYVY